MKELTQQPVLFIDGTPDDEYVMRILRAYRDNCNSKWATATDGSCDNPMFQLMNEHQDQRAKVLDEAIKKMESYASQQMPSDDTFEQVLKEEFLVNTQNYPKEYHDLFMKKFRRAEDAFKSLQQENQTED